MKDNKYIRLIKDTLALFGNNEMAVYAGYATLHILMAMVPLLMLVISIVNIMPGYSAADFSAFIFSYLPEIPQVKDMLSEVIANLNRQSGGLIVSISALTTLWSASSGVSSIQMGLEKLYGTVRPSLKGKPAALLFTLLYILLIPSMLIFQVLGSSITGLIETVLAGIGLEALASRIILLFRYSGIIALVLMVFVILLTYACLPNGKRTVRSQLPGAVFSCVLWALFTLAFAFFIPRFWKASSVYGSLAAVFLAAMWLEIIITILFYGAALNKAIGNS